MKSVFVTAIDTEIGKTIITGLIARYFLKKGINVMTQKLVQTGCEKISEDILTHRKLMKIELNQYDYDQITCPYLFKYPASPHLAGELENKTINFEKIKKDYFILKNQFEKLIVEGAGGLCVPLTRKKTILDFIKEMEWPVVVVTSSRLGSINHTLMTLKLLEYEKVKVLGLVYNHYPEEKSEITNDSKILFQEMFSHIPLIEIERFDLNQEKIPEINFDLFFHEEFSH